MRIYAVLLALVALLLAAAPVWCYTSLGGPTGVVSMPSAGVVPAGSLDLAVDYQKVSGTRIIPLRATYGYGGNAELWGTFVDIGGDGAAISTDAGAAAITRAWNLGAKYRFSTETERGMALAVGGAFGRLENDESINTVNLFVVASKSLSIRHAGSEGLAAQAHLGLMWARFDDPVGQSLTQPFIGFEVFGDNGASLGVDYRFKDSTVDADAPLSLVFRYPVAGENNPLWLELGTTNAAVAGIGASDNSWFVGLGYRLGPKAEPTSAPGTRTRPWGY